MKIHATFANYKHDPEVVQLVDAWDEYCLDENPTGFEESKERALMSLGDDLLRWVTVEIDVDDTAIYEALSPEPSVTGAITHVGETGTGQPATAATTEDGR